MVFSNSEEDIAMKRSMNIAAIWMTVCLVLIGGSAYAERAIKITSRYDGASLHKEYSSGTNYALVIGINEYESHPNLKTAINDANAVAKLLEEKYFFEKQNIVFLKDRDATKDHIMREFRDLVAEKVKKGDNVFIYYAGHGWFDDILESGYWVTAEATKSPATFLENNTIYKLIAALDRKGVQHVLLVSDSCFSGSFTKDHRAIETDIDDRYFREKYGKPSRNILTSGGMEPVEDVGKGGHSIFAYYFLKTLKDNPHPYLSGKQVGVQVEELVTRNSTQTPISKFIHGVGDEGGQFFFINRKSGTPKVSPGSITAKAQDSTELEKERKLLKQERLELERLKTEIERKKLEAERKRLEVEKEKLEMAKLPPKPKYSPPTHRSSEVGRDGMFIAYANGIVEDTKTGLEWFTDPDKYLDWAEAKSWVKSLLIDGGGWRLPTINELRTLYNEGSGTHNRTPLLIFDQYWVWSGVKKGFLSTQARAFYFKDGTDGLAERDNFNLGTLAVRSRR
jgi:uncharacterized caspase-like protein